MTSIGVISDTHSLLRAEAVAALQGSDMIIHAGDIGSAAVIDGLARIAPVNAIRGNIDKGEWAKQFLPAQTIEVQGKCVYILHNLKDLDFDPATEGYHLIISGHSHKPAIAEKDGVLYLNPGSAGPRRFKLPITVARVRINARDMYAEIQELPV